MHVLLTNITDPERPSDAVTVTNLTYFTTFADLRAERVAPAAKDALRLTEEGDYLILVIATEPYFAGVRKTVTVEVRLAHPQQPVEPVGAAVLWDGED